MSKNLSKNMQLQLLSCSHDHQSKHSPDKTCQKGILTVPLLITFLFSTLSVLSIYIHFSNLLDSCTIIQNLTKRVCIINMGCIKENVI